jgi:hypothetical protein
MAVIVELVYDASRCIELNEVLIWRERCVRGEDYLARKIGGTFVGCTMLSCTCTCTSPPAVATTTDDDDDDDGNVGAGMRRKAG